MGLEQKNFDGTGLADGLEELRLSSFLREASNPGFLPPIQGVNDRAESTAQSLMRGAPRIERRSIDAYSAAATNEGFTFAADAMKSEMRGTISDLKREPLKTP